MNTDNKRLEEILELAVKLANQFEEERNITDSLFMLAQLILESESLYGTQKSMALKRLEEIFDILYGENVEIKE